MERTVNKKEVTKKKNQVQIQFKTTLKDASAISRQLAERGLQDQKGINILTHISDTICVSQPQENTTQLDNLSKLKCDRARFIDDEQHDIQYFEDIDLTKLVSGRFDYTPRITKGLANTEPDEEGIRYPGGCHYHLPKNKQSMGNGGDVGHVESELDLLDIKQLTDENNYSPKNLNDFQIKKDKDQDNQFNQVSTKYNHNQHYSTNHLLKNQRSQNNNEKLILNKTPQDQVINCNNMSLIDNESNSNLNPIVKHTIFRSKLNLEDDYPPTNMEEHLLKNIPTASTSDPSHDWYLPKYTPQCASAHLVAFPSLQPLNSYKSNPVEQNEYELLELINKEGYDVITNDSYKSNQSSNEMYHINKINNQLLVNGNINANINNNINAIINSNEVKDNNDFTEFSPMMTNEQGAPMQINHESIHNLKQSPGKIELKEFSDDMQTPVNQNKQFNHNPFQQKNVGNTTELSGQVVQNRDRVLHSHGGVTPTHLNSINTNISANNSDLRNEQSLFSSGERPVNVTDYNHKLSTEQEANLHNDMLSPMMSNSNSKTNSNLQNNKANFINFNNKNGTHPYFTTLMIKNIPNRLTQNILLNQIDEGFLGCYDFFQMPIDKESQANQGYAFINMTHTCQVEEFGIKFHEYKWPHACSSKVCMITYARIQGYEKLCYSFQNEKKFSDKLPKPNIYARCMTEIYYKELPMTAETPWRNYKTITNLQRASDLPIARVLQQRNMQNNKAGFDQVWPKIFKMIKDKLITTNSLNQDNIDQEQFKKVCREVYTKTKKEWERNIRTQPPTPSISTCPTNILQPSESNGVSTSFMSHSDPVHTDENISINKEVTDMQYENLFHCNSQEKCNLVEQKLEGMQNADNAKLEDVIKSEQYLFMEFNDQNLQILPNLYKPPGIQIRC